MVSQSEGCIFRKVVSNCTFIFHLLLRVWEGEGECYRH